jgi:PEP-CTERM motif
MTKKSTLVLPCLALLVSLSSVALADAITFTFLGSLQPVHINSTGFSAGPALVLLVSDTQIPATNLLVGAASISTGAAASYTAAAGVVTAQYLPGPGVEVDVNSASCVGGAMPGVCLQGSSNSNGQYVGTRLGTGSFQALFQVDYVSPYITSLFGDPNQWLPSGSDSLNTAANLFKNGGTKDDALLTGGTISLQTPVPEPGSLALLGSGILGLATVIRRKLV